MPPIKLAMIVTISYRTRLQLKWNSSDLVMSEVFCGHHSQPALHRLLGSEYADTKQFVVHQEDSTWKQHTFQCQLLLLTILDSYTKYTEVYIKSLCWRLTEALHCKPFSLREEKSHNNLKVLLFAGPSVKHIYTIYNWQWESECN